MGTEEQAVDLLANAIAEDDAPIETPEVQPEPEAQTATVEPEGEKPAGQTQEGESVEDIKASRAYHQTKAQQEAELRKALQDEVGALREQLAKAGSLEGFEFEEPPVEEPEKQPATIPTQQTQLPYEPDPESDVGVLLAEIRSLKKEIGDVKADSAAQKAEKRAQEIAEARQQKLMSRFRDEVTTVNTQFSAFTKKHEVPDEEVQRAIKRAGDNLLSSEKDYYQVGMPSKIARLATEFIVDYLAQRGREQRTETQRLTDEQKVEAVKNAASPGGAATLAPTGEVADWNKRAADDIAPDDRPV